MRIVPGIKLRARGLVWEVCAAEPCGAQTRLSLRCAAGDLAGLEWEMLHPAEPVALADLALRPEAPGRLADWQMHHIAALLREDPEPGTLLAGPPPEVIPEPYQLVPLLRALRMPRPRLLLADGVGLGKTIQAGLVLSELMARRRAHRAIVVAPAGPLLTQWVGELRTRFGLRPEVLADAASLRGREARLESGGNPFDAALVLTTPDFAKQDSVLEALDRTSWDVAILDEAHHYAAGATDGEATQRRRLAELLARRTEGLLLLTATPHDGDDRHFASVLTLLDPTLVGADGLPLGQAYRAHVVRRLKAHLHDPATGMPLFRPRRVVPVPVDLDGAALAPVRAFHQGLADLLRPRLRQIGGEGADPADLLAFTGLLKRSVSTIAAAVATLRVVAARHAAQAVLPVTAARRRDRARVLAALRRRAVRQGVLTAREEEAQTVLETQGMAAALGGGATAMLQALIDLGVASIAQDPKLAALKREIAAIRAADPDANVLVYTEYTDSLDAARAGLLAAGYDPDSVLAICGRDGDAARTRAADRFGAGTGLVLLSTDSMAEGLNLHRFCHHLLHLDLPYNPNRLEQRNGRIDRYGQTRDPVILYPYLCGTFEERLLLRLIAKYEQARAALDHMPTTLPLTADPAAWAPDLVRGFAEEQAPLFPPPPSALRGLETEAEATDAEAWRALRREIDRAYAAFDRMAVHHGWLRPDRRADATPAPVVASRHALRGQSAAGFLRAAGVAVGPERITWAHPAMGSAAERVLARALGDGPDPRVACARHAQGPGLLATFAVEDPDGRCAFRRIAGVLVFPAAAPRVIDDPAEWFALAAVDADASWPHEFAAWAPGALFAAGEAAAASIAPALDRFRDERRRAGARERAQLDRWLAGHADALCGAAEAENVDLFGFRPDLPAWRCGPDPMRRLGAYAADASRPADMRAEARDLLITYGGRMRSLAAVMTERPPALTPVGLLMLVP